MSSVVVKSPTEYRKQRSDLLKRVGMTYPRMRKLADEYKLSPEQQDVWVTIEAIDYVLGDHK